MSSVPLLYLWVVCLFCTAVLPFECKCCDTMSNLRSTKGKLSLHVGLINSCSVLPALPKHTGIEYVALSHGKNPQWQPMVISPFLLLHRSHLSSPPIGTQQALSLVDLCVSVQVKAKAVKDDESGEDQERASEEEEEQEEAADHAETASEQPKIGKKAVVRPPASPPPASNSKAPDDSPGKTSKAKKSSAKKSS